MKVSLAALLASGLFATVHGMSEQAVTAAAVTQAASTEAGGSDATANRVAREGVVVEFEARPVKGVDGEVMAADWSDVTFRITDANTGEPIKGRYPAAWMDLGLAWEARGERPMTCEGRVSTYLQGIVGVRPMIDLNSHFLLVLNRDSSISVIDPAVGITGITNLFAQINIIKPGADWAKTGDQKTLFVSMPTANMVAFIETESFEVTSNINAGDNPTRTVLQGDERYLWVGNNSEQAESSGVTVIDSDTLKKVAFIETGMGHHEIAFSEDDQFAFVSNRDSGTVSVIDVQQLKKIKDLVTGPLPISLGYSPLGDAVYVADGKTGTISVIDARKHEIRASIDAKPGLGPMRFSQDGRWGMVVNPVANTVFAIDASKDRLAHAIKVGKQPYQVNFTRGYGYVRSLGTQDVALIPVSELDKDDVPPITYIPAGQQPPGVAKDISIADSIVPSVKQAAAYIINQAEGTVHYYMEGMAAPMGAFRNYGHDARAIEIVDRSLSEREPGVYTGRVKIPIEGTYDVAFMMDTPRFLHCFTAVVKPNPDIEVSTAPMHIEYLDNKRRVPVGESTKIKFKLTDPKTTLPRHDIPDVRVLYYGSDGRGRRVVPAKSLGGGVYEAEVKITRFVTYYIYVGIESEELEYTDLPFFSVLATQPEPKKKPAAPQVKAEGRS